MSKLHTEAFVEWTVNPASALNPTATKAAIANIRHFVTSLGISFSAATTTIGTLTLSLGASSLVVQIPVGQLAPIFFTWTKALRADTNVAVTAVVAATGAGIQSVFVTGYSVRE